MQYYYFMYVYTCISGIICIIQLYHNNVNIHYIYIYTVFKYKYKCIYIHEIYLHTYVCIHICAYKINTADEATNP